MSERWNDTLETANHESDATYAQKDLNTTEKESILWLDMRQVATLLQTQFLTSPINTKNKQYCFSVQKALSLLWFPIECTWVYDKQTKEIVKEFEAAYDLTVDNGVAWSEVLWKMISVLGNRIPREKKKQSIDTNHTTYESMNTEQRAQYCFKKLKELWFSAIIAAWIIGNLREESFDWRNTKKRFHTNTYWDWGKSFWLCQWNNNGADWEKKWRRLLLEQFANARGCDPTNVDCQLAFIQEEFNSSEKNARAKIQYASNPEESALLFMQEYERPSNRSTLKTRQKKAKEVYTLYS
jgi:hypothetical protein